MLAHPSLQYSLNYLAARGSVGEAITTLLSGKAKLMYLPIKKSMSDLPVLVGYSAKIN